MCWRIILIIFHLGLLAACSVVTREPQDGAPSQSIDVASIPDAQPQPVVRTRAGNASVYSVFGKTYRVMADSRGYRERGKASWYGTKFHGRRTANGEVYNMYAMTAAHKTLPIPSYVRVTRVATGQSVVVRINDRGPFKDDRLIDLSYAAAKKLGIDRIGVDWVDVVDITPEPGQIVRQPAVTEPVVTSAVPAPTPTSTPTPVILEADSKANNSVAGLYLQLGAFTERETALSLRSQVLGMVMAPVKVIEGQDRLHRVKLGPDTEQRLLAWRRILQANGVGEGFIIERN